MSQSTIPTTSSAITMFTIDLIFPASVRRVLTNHPTTATTTSANTRSSNGILSPFRNDGLQLAGQRCAILRIRESPPLDLPSGQTGVRPPHRTVSVLDKRLDCATLRGSSYNWRPDPTARRSDVLRCAVSKALQIRSAATHITQFATRG